MELGGEAESTPVQYTKPVLKALDGDTATFTPDITPLILAAHTDNYEVIKILLDRGAVMPTPHHQR